MRPPDVPVLDLRAPLRRESGVTLVQRLLFDDLEDELQPPAEPGCAPPPDRTALLEAVRIPALACTRCPLSKTRTNVVFGEGNPESPLVFVGEGPGESEDLTGRPFVGKAGKLLDELLGRCRLTRQHVYICNVVKCRAADYEGRRARNRPPLPEEMNACRPWLDQQLAIIAPRVIVCVGAPSANTIIHRPFRITAERGIWFDNSPYAPWTMAIFHPAYLLRQHGAAYDAAVELTVADIERARLKVVELRKQAAASGNADSETARRSD